MTLRRHLLAFQLCYISTFFIGISCLKAFTFVTLLFFSFATVAEITKQQQFDRLIEEISSGERYFFKPEDFRQTLAELENALPQNDAERASILDRHRCLLAYFDDPAAGIAFSKTKLNQAQSANDFPAQYDYHTCRYHLYYMLGENKQAVESAKLAHSAAEYSEDPLSIALSETELGNISSYQGDYADALNHYLSAYQRFQQLGYKPYISDLVLSIASAYRRMGLYDKAITYIDEAEKEFNAPEERFRHAMIMHEKAFSYAEIGQPEQALALFKQSIDVYNELAVPEWIAYTNVNLVWIYNLLGQFDNALNIAAEAESMLSSGNIANIANSQTYQALLALYKGEALLADKQVNTALESLALADQLLSEQAVPRYMLQLHLHYADALAQAGQYSLAYTKLGQYVELNNRQQANAREQQANLLRFQFDFTRQQEKNDQLAAEKLAAEQYISTLQLAQRWQYVAIIAIVLMLFILVSFAVSLKKRNRKLHRLAMTDELTGIANRRRIMMLAEQERVKATETSSPICLLIIDLDHFKKINDNHGHDAGDIVLQQVCLTISSVLRQQDHFGRTGGEEFLIILPNTDINQAQPIAERVRRSVAAINLSLIQLNLQVSCSIGLTQAKPKELLNASISRADKALYQAKANGRNQVVEG
ncbi:tetratricopeptide repeat-containing diguanylate cyclase [Rheinheimera baltica]|uniref:tetratricopeptide repeat-containing diguanylate cyclase n=1 Tax=Rheinheimera baltica TaxID=67576 RepID=UPI00041F976E|nr:tetratricopeptide repeat-containing diguanylate cyclase [Rheinheimera baltica]